MHHAIREPTRDQGLYDHGKRYGPRKRKRKKKNSARQAPEKRPKRLAKDKKCDLIVFEQYTRTGHLVVKKPPIHSLDA